MPERRPPVTRQQPSAAPPPPSPADSGQQQYGFVNFEPLPVEPAPAMPPADTENNGSSGQSPELSTDRNSSGGKPFPVPGHTAEPEPKPHAGNGHSVPYPQKQRTASRSQMDVKDYSVYHVDAAQQADQQLSSSNDTNDIEDSDIRNLNTPPGKQQKGFLSKFFNRDEQ
jgi:hypothetical protein